MCLASVFNWTTTLQHAPAPACQWRQWWRHVTAVWTAPDHVVQWYKSRDQTRAVLRRRPMTLGLMRDSTQTTPQLHDELTAEHTDNRNVQNFHKEIMHSCHTLLHIFSRRPSWTSIQTRPLAINRFFSLFFWHGYMQQIKLAPASFLVQM